MTNDREKTNEVIESEDTTKTPYQKPSLLNLGKLASLTMGSQPGTGESGNPLVFRSTN